MIISGMGELHLEVIKNRMLSEYKVDANVGTPKVSYTGKRLVKRLRLKGNLFNRRVVMVSLDMWITLEPYKGDEPVTFVDAIKGGKIPKQYVRSVEKEFG